MAAWSEQGVPRFGLSVVICAYTVERWVQLQDAVRSLQDQRRPVDEIVVVVDHNSELLARAQATWPGAVGGPGVAVVRVRASTGARGLSGARNTGVAAAVGEIVAFLDDDARADQRWSDELLAPYSDPRVVACGGAAEPDLGSPRPVWWPLEFDWVVGCSYRGLPRAQTSVRNLIGANMSARRAAVDEVGGFSEGIGRVGARPSGCEETDLFIRVAQRWPDSRVVYEPRARVHHSVPPARLSWRYFRSRCFAEGVSKAQVAARVGSGPALASERSYVLRVLPLGIARGLAGACRGEVGAGRRALAIVAGLVITSAGYAGGRIRASTGRPPPAKRLVAT